MVKLPPPLSMQLQDEIDRLKAKVGRVAYRGRRIVERKVDKRLGWVEVLECGHIHVMTKADKINFPYLGKVADGHRFTSRHCFECVKPAGD